MIKKNPVLSLLRRYGAMLLCAAALYMLVYNVVFTFRQTKGIYADYSAHTVWAMAMSRKEILASFYNGSDSLWHVCVRLVCALFQPNIWKSAAIVTAVADTAAYVIVFMVLERVLPEKFPRLLLALIVAVVFVVNDQLIPGGPFYIKDDGVVKGSLNTWHNPTSIMVRPFAVAVFYMTVNIYNRRRYGRSDLLAGPEDGNVSFAFAGGFWQQFSTPVYSRAELVLYPLCLLFSVYAKPSFLQFFAPAILVILLIDVVRTKGMILPFCAKLALAYLPAAFIMLMQFLRFFDGGIAVGPEVAASVGAPAINISTLAARTGTGLSALAAHSVRVFFIAESFAGPGEFLLKAGGACLWILMFCSFPVFVILATMPKNGLRSTAIRLGLAGTVTAWLEALLLHEAGSRATHGNFIWGYSLATWMFWLAAIGQFTVLLRSKSTGGKLARYGGTALLLCHLISGVIYVMLIMQTREYQM